MREEANEEKCHYPQQRLKSLHHSMWTVKERSPECVAAGYHQSCPGCDQLRCGRSAKKKGRIGVQEQISKIQAGDLSHRIALPVPDRLMRLW